MQVERIDHIHIIVNDLEGAMSFFSDIMGTKFIGPIDLRPRVEMRTAFDTMGLELLSPTSKEHFLGAILDKEGEGFLSIGLKVSDIDEAVAVFEAKGLALEARGERPALRWAIFKPEKAYNVRIELVQYDAPVSAGVVNLINAGLIDKLPWYEEPSSSK
jgi:catechol 2,3-dioxygenase-like lactoylglutathione lyase family enzyme